MSLYNKQTFYHVLPKPEGFQTETFETDAVDGGALNYENFVKVYKFDDGIKDFVNLRQELVRSKTLFNDARFSPETIALTELEREVIWKRPYEISENPKLIVDGATRFDINQGQLGDCWFLAAVANLTFNEKLLSMVVPTDQDFTANYAGIFHFRFWQYGRWVDVVIDDRLPTIDNKLVYLASKDQNEFWPALLEKAYAKLYGSYKNIDGGQIAEALEDFCGGLSENYSANRPEIFEIMSMSYEMSSFIGCTITSSECEVTKDGLVTGHAYSITDITILRVGVSDKKLIRIRNPWGNEVEWNGNWSDKSICWNSVPQKTRQEFLVEKDDGEFWMEINDFQKRFSFVDICHLNPSSFDFSENSINWNVSMFNGSWTDNKDTTFGNNPHYIFFVRGDNSKEKYAMVIGLMQKDRRLHGKDELPLELDIFWLQFPQQPSLDKSFFQSHKPLLNQKGNGARQLTVRVMLHPGRYCLVPSTRKPNDSESYLLRIYSEASANVTCPATQ